MNRNTSEVQITEIRKSRFNQLQNCKRVIGSNVVFVNFYVSCLKDTSESHKVVVKKNGDA